MCAYGGGIYVKLYGKADTPLSMFFASGYACWPVFSTMDTYVLFTDHIKRKSVYLCARVCVCVCVEEGEELPATSI